MKRIVFLFFISLFNFPVFCLSANKINNECLPGSQSDTIIINLRDYGLEKTRNKDCTKIINKALNEIDNSKPAIIRFPLGEYHFYPDESLKRNYTEINTPDNLINCALLFENHKNLLIDGNGSTLIFHGQIQPFTFDNCKNVTIKNINIDWELPLTAQAKVIKSNDEFIELAIDFKESPNLIENGKLYFITGTNEKEPWNSTVEFDRKDRYIVPQTGDSECLGKGWENYAVENMIPGIIRLYYPFLRKPVIGNILVMQYADPSHSGIYIRNSTDISVENVNIFHASGNGILAQLSNNLTFYEFRATPDRIRNRYFSCGNGGLWISDCTGKIVVENCEFEGLMNTPVNILSTIKNNNSNENSALSTDVSIINSWFKSSRASGIRISASAKVVILNNTFASSGSAILIAGDSANKSEPGGITDVLIENNEFTDLCNTSQYEYCEGIISIYPVIQGFNENTTPFHKNIRITGNRFNTSDYPLLFARSVNGLTFENNTVTGSKRFEPFHNRNYSFTFEGCSKISVNNNAFSDEVPGKNIQLKWMPESELNCSQPELTITRMKTSE